MARTSPEEQVERMGRYRQTTSGCRPTGEPDRRRICRYPVVESPAWLGWWNQEEFQTTPGHILDISLRGCKLKVHRFPPHPKEISVWFCPHGTAPTEWIESRIVETHRALFGPRVVRLVFAKPFPYETFKHLVYGPDALQGPTAPKSRVPESERDYW